MVLLSNIAYCSPESGGGQGGNNGGSDSSASGIPADINPGVLSGFAQMAENLSTAWGNTQAGVDAAQGAVAGAIQNAQG